MNNKGFTLIELMITVAILGIIAAIAIPSYQNSVTKSRRAEAKTFLVEAAAIQEKNMALKNTYLDGSVAADLTKLGAVSGKSENGYYTITGKKNAAGSEPKLTHCMATGATHNCFLIIAEAAGAQAGDTSCKYFTINQLGQKKAYDSNKADKTQDCW